MYSKYNPYSIFLVGGAGQRMQKIIYERFGPTNHKLPKSLRINDMSPQEITRLMYREHRTESGADELELNQEVKVHDLVSNASINLNGKIGKILNPTMNENGRYLIEVKIDDETYRKILLLPKNFKRRKEPSISEGVRTTHTRSPPSALFPEGKVKIRPTDVFIPDAFVHYTKLKCAEPDPNNVFLLKAHGAILPGQFVLPDNVKLITMSDLGRSLRIQTDSHLGTRGPGSGSTIRVCEAIALIYEYGNSLFKNNDQNPNAITEIADSLINKDTKDDTDARPGRLGATQRLKLNLPGDLVNNQLLSFIEGCDTTGGGTYPDFCGITVIKPSEPDGHRLLTRNCLRHSIYVNFDNRGIGHVTLEDIIKINGPGTYISCSCRVYDPIMDQLDEALSISTSTNVARPRIGPPARQVHEVLSPRPPRL